MSNITANNKQSIRTIENTVHFVMQGKGGVGKTTIAMFLLQALQQYTPKKIYGIDTDPVNQTFASFKTLGVEPVFIMGEDNEVNPLKFDTLVDAILADNNNFVIDTGATSYLPTFNYLKNTEIIDLLREHKKTIYIHVPISGGQATADTISELNDLATTFKGAKLVIWENQFFGEIDTSFNENKAYINTLKIAIGRIVLKKLDPKTDGFLYTKMTSELKGFADVINDTTVSFMTRRRMGKLFNELTEQIIAVIVPDSTDTANKLALENVPVKSK
jgi:shikimate kinase